MLKTEMYHQIKNRLAETVHLKLENADPFQLGLFDMLAKLLALHVLVALSDAYALPIDDVKSAVRFSAPEDPDADTDLASATWESYPEALLSPVTDADFRRKLRSAPIRNVFQTLQALWGLQEMLRGKLDRASVH
ncbi:hypothetical protein [Thiomonas sp.]